jgi:hypothetical protein
LSFHAENALRCLGGRGEDRGHTNSTQAARDAKSLYHVIDTDWEPSPFFQDFGGFLGNSDPLEAFTFDYVIANLEKMPPEARRFTDFVVMTWRPDMYVDD